MKAWKKSLFALSVVGLALGGFSGCSSGDDEKKSDSVSVEIEKTLDIAVFSDDHLYDAVSLGATGSALESYISNDRKMLLESERIVDAVLSDLKNRSNLRYLFICGDLTKDGERVNHELLASKLQALEDETNIEVFVINGNHDLSNQNAVKYDGDTTTAVETVDCEDFRSIYANFGYNQAVSKHSASLPYSADLGDNYRLISIDSCLILVSSRFYFQSI